MMISLMLNPYSQWVDIINDISKFRINIDNRITCKMLVHVPHGFTWLIRYQWIFPPSFPSIHYQHGGCVLSASYWCHRGSVPLRFGEIPDCYTVLQSPYTALTAGNLPAVSAVQGDCERVYEDSLQISVTCRTNAQTDFSTDSTHLTEINRT